MKYFEYKIEKIDMPDDLKQTVTDVALIALIKYTGEEDLALYIKSWLDKKQGGNWGCLVT